MKSIHSLLLVALITFQSASAIDAGKVNIAELSSDFQGIDKDSALRFSWKLKKEGRAQLQGSYRILLSNSAKSLETNGKLVWDSGEIQSVQSLYIPYTGPALESGQTYFWKVQLKNNEKQAGEWSSAAQITLPKKGEKEAEAGGKNDVKPTAPIASFESSDANLNSLFEKARNTQRKLLTTPATFEPDGLPWGAPLQLTARGFAFQNELSDYYRIANEQLFAEVSEDKLIPSLVGESGDNEPSPGFSEAGIVIPFVMWQLTGDFTLAKPTFIPAVNHVILMQKNDPEYSGKPFGKDLGDWGHKDDPTSAGYLALCQMAQNCRILGEVANAAHHLPYIAQHKEWYHRIQKAFPEHFLEDEKLKEKSQTAQILSLRLGLLPQELKQPIADALAERIKKEGLTAGMFGQAAVLPVLSWTNHHEQAVELAQSYGAENAEPSVVSLAATTDWMMSFLAGFIHQTPGFQTSRISPFIPEEGSITEVKAHHETPYGRLAIHWQKTKNGLTSEVTIPPNTVGIISLPVDEKATVTESGKSLEDAIGCQFMRDINGRKEIIAQSGTYQFEVKNP